MICTLKVSYFVLNLLRIQQLNQGLRFLGELYKMFRRRHHKILQQSVPSLLHVVHIQFRMLAFFVDVAYLPKIHDMRYRGFHGTSFLIVWHERAIPSQSNVQRVKHEIQLIGGCAIHVPLNGHCLLV